MLKYIKFKNYRSLTDITFDFTEKNGLPKPFFILYGENGSGKSNFVSGFNTLKETFYAFSTRHLIFQLLQKDNFNDSDFAQIKDRLDIANLIHQNKTIDSSENMSLELGFLINNKSGKYYIEFDDNQIVSERLDYTLSKHSGCYFFISNTGDKKINNSVFSNSFEYDIRDFIEKFWGKYSLLSFLFNSSEEYSEEYLSSAYNENVKKIMEYFDSVTTQFASERNENYFFESNKTFISLIEDETEEENLPLLNTIQDNLNKYFTHLYRDINEIYYKKVNLDKGQIHYELFEKKNISGNEIDISFKKESTGTKTLLNLFQPLILSASGKISIIDEIDNGIHDVLLNNLMKCIQKNGIKGQLIVTTHNSLLMNEYCLKDYIFFIDISDNSEKSIKSITDYDFRIQPGTNILSNYLQQKFARLPWMNMNLNLNEFISNP